MTPDDNLLAGVNLSQFTEAQRQKIIETIYSKLEDRVGVKMVSMVSDEQFDQFELLVDQANEDKLGEWLSDNVPSYDEEVEVILLQLKQEVVADPQNFLAEAA